MKTNYQIIMENIINNLKGKPSLLLHACCGVCSSSVLEKLLPYFNITVLYYNPNIYPEEEYIKRYNTLKELISKMNIDVKLIKREYKSEEFENIAKGLEDEKEGGERCTKCFYLRLNETAKIAKENNYDYFCTTLSVSPYSENKMEKSNDTTIGELMDDINKGIEETNKAKLPKIGKILESKYKIKYLYSDFKKKEGYKRSNELSKKYNLYRQHYCGCRYSLNEIK